MDTSFWIQYNPKITVDHTVKKYFGKYLYKLVVYAPAGRLIDTSKGSMVDALEHRRTVHKNINHAGWWGIRYQKDLDNADTELLSELRDIRHNRTLGLKLRVEEPRIQIYAETEQQLRDLVKNNFKSSWQAYVETIAGPEDSEAEAVLNTGAIIRKNDVGYRYKVILKDGRYGQEIKRNVLQYLLNLGERQASLSKSTYDMLDRPTDYMWNVYFYTNDPGVNIFLNLISPGIVSNIHELIILPHK